MFWEFEELLPSSHWVSSGLRPSHVCSGLQQQQQQQDREKEKKGLKKEERKERKRQDRKEEKRKENKKKVSTCLRTQWILWYWMEAELLPNCLSASWIEETTFEKWKFLDERTQTCIKYYHFLNNLIFLWLLKTFWLFVTNLKIKIKTTNVGYLCRRILHYQYFPEL